MPGTFTVQLPPGTNQTRLVNVPHAGSWLGGVVCSIATHSTDAQIHEFIFISSDVPGNPNVKSYRHVGNVAQGAATRGYDEWVLDADSRIWFVLFKGENMAKIRYTSTQEISLNVETTKTDWSALAMPNYQVPPAKLYLYDGRIEWKSKP